MRRGSSPWGGTSGRSTGIRSSRAMAASRRGAPASDCSPAPSVESIMPAAAALPHALSRPGFWVMAPLTGQGAPQPQPSRGTGRRSGMEISRRAAVDLPVGVKTRHRNGAAAKREQPCCAAEM